MGAVNFNKFTLGLERVPESGPVEESGRVVLDSNKDGKAPGTEWVCEKDPEEGVEIDCADRGVLEMEMEIASRLSIYY